MKPEFKKRMEDVVFLALLVVTLILAGATLRPESEGGRWFVEVLKIPTKISTKLSPEAGVATATATGSGIFVAPDKVLTALHVIEGKLSKEIWVFDAEKRPHEVIDVIVPQNVDAAILILKDKVNVDPVHLDTSPRERGELLHYTGAPAHGEFGYLYREGVVMGWSSVDLSDTNSVTRADVYPDLILLDLAVLSGDSGSGVLDEDGELVGLLVLNVRHSSWAGVLPLSAFRGLLWE